MDRSRSVVALATALIGLWPTLLQAESTTSTSAAGWQQAGDMPSLIATLEGWLDTQSTWPRRDAPPRVMLLSPWQAAARQGATASVQRGRLRGLYDPDRSEIVLVQPWDRKSAHDVSVLLHELAHHRQAPHHWYCPAAQELPAYRLQEAWLSEQGQTADVNWVAVVLDAGCSPRDIHPD